MKIWEAINTKLRDEPAGTQTALPGVLDGVPLSQGARVYNDDYVNLRYNGRKK